MRIASQRLRDLEKKFPKSQNKLRQRSFDAQIKFSSQEKKSKHFLEREGDGFPLGSLDYLFLYIDEVGAMRREEAVRDLFCPPLSMFLKITSDPLTSLDLMGVVTPSDKWRATSINGLSYN